MTRVISQTETIEALCTKNVALNIPSYQRPYVWPAEDVVKLLDDVAAALSDGQPRYYIGTLISARRPPTVGEAACSHELIDGQQRMTTLCLLALAFRKRLPDHDLAQMTRLGTRPRLTFMIREQAQAFLAREAELAPSIDFDDAALTSLYLIHLQQGLNAARQRLDQLARAKTDLRQLADYLYKSVEWVNNVVPAAMNLNHLFARINTGGVQLEQSDILKAQLLRKITRHKPRYDAIWQACEDMNNYFERNVRQLFPLTDWENTGYDDLAQFDAERFTLPGEHSTEGGGLTLGQLASDSGQGTDDVKAPLSVAINGRSHGDDAADSDDEDDSEDTGWRRSIIGFPLLLMHTYRIFLSEKGEDDDIDCRLHAARFGECFGDFARRATEHEAVAFIECLWLVRYQFDRWVAKWVKRENDDTEHLYLGSVTANTSRGRKRFSRYYPESTPDLVQLQAVRYFTGERTAQYWLSPFLGMMIRMMRDTGFRKLNGPEAMATALRDLERIDNVLSAARNTQKEASFALLRGQSPVCDDFSVLDGHLREPLGTGFEHYWFLKLEYVLWKRRTELPELQQERWISFRITSKNSVEHVYPQQHEHHNERLDRRMLDSFGNLALLSPGENSSYSNQDPGKKLIDFDAKPVYDSLKLAHIFAPMRLNRWSPSSIRVHLDSMLELLREHYDRT
ncbi:DUF262 domain-containing protein [Paraburkholderia sp. C35]|uniref:DUF262 domain-containing protein n=1 Tax=Paraburkholderia sp. C35 TaxID=2126993 RepID=UPI000D6978A2|nr:DUF262 domain-containing protein [Paraburkholderia sp. C35]